MAITLQNNITPSNTTTATYSETYNSVTINCNDGYVFDVAPTVSYTDENGDYVTKNCTLNNSKKRATVYITDIDDGETVDINGATVVYVASVNLVNAITPENSTTATYDLTTGLLTVTCNDGYKFDVAPSYSFYDDYGDLVNGSLTLSTDGKTATHTFDVSAESGIPLENEKLNVDGETVEDTTVSGVTVTNNIANTTETHEYNDGVLTITVTGNYTRRYGLFNVVATVDGETHDFTVSNNGVGTATANVTFNVTDGKEVTITGEYIQIVPVDKTLDNCTGEIPVYYKIGDTLDLTLTANSGNEFTEQPTLSYDDETGNLQQRYFTVSDDKQTATLTGFTVPETQSLSVYAVASVVTPVATSYGAINVYVVTLDNLKSFSNVRFFTEKNDTTGELTYIDLGKYVNRIKRIYCNIATGASDVIQCGNYNTHVSVNAPETDKITLDFGNVTIPNHNNDNTDFQNEVSLFVPFVGFVSISNELTGKEVNLQVVIDVVTGNGVFMLYHNGIMFQCGNLTPCNDVLYKTADLELTTIGNDQWNENNLLGLQPYIYCKWYESKNHNGRNTDNKRGVISTFTGFNVFDDVTPIHTPEMLATEQEDIYNLLQSGVYVE